MPSVTLRKSDKLHALRGMINAKFLRRYKALMTRRSEMAQRVYDNTLGKTGYAIKDAAGKDWQIWCETRGSVRLEGVDMPACIVDAGQRSSMYRSGLKDHFTDVDSRRMDRQTVQLKGDVVWPDREFNHAVFADRADKDTRRVDEMFPELWRYLPEGMRERIKQAVVQISQDDVDAIRKQLPRGSK